MPASRNSGAAGRVRTRSTGARATLGNNAAVAALVVVIVLSVLFAMTIGLQDAANAVAALVATRVARPSRAVLFAGVFSLLGSFLPSTAVAATMAGLVQLSGSDLLAAVGAAVSAATLFDLVA